jgi:hypothetical protein
MSEQSVDLQLGANEIPLSASTASTAPRNIVDPVLDQNVGFVAPYYGGLLLGFVQQLIQKSTYFNHPQRHQQASKLSH